MKISIKAIPISGKVFLITIIICLILSGIYFLPFPKDYHGRPCGVNINEYTESIFLYGMLLAAIVALVEFVVSFVRKAPKIRIFIVLVLSLILSATAILMALSSARSKSWVASIKAEITSLRAPQELFYDDNGRYANTQEELIEAGFISEKLKNRMTGEEYTDKDGSGIEGGDDNPKTWEIVTFIPTKQFDNWCKRVKEGYWITCNQDGCE